MLLLDIIRNFNIYKKIFIVILERQEEKKFSFKGSDNN